ncbi:sphingomyelin phosphodiesterase [Pseudonocardiaceae bacterium YIM PH 21723]|nr:sphingomyelin phosphodiesterase [Pseudonocardiaceae bacterium YIM PH 21723]
MRRRILFTFAALALGATALLAPHAVTASPVAATAPKIASYNVFLFSKTLYPNWGQDQRVDLIVKDKVVSGQDVVVFQEAFENSSSDRLISKLAGEYPHATPVVGRSTSGWDKTENYSSTTPEDGGVTILSKWPIETKMQHIYKQGCGADYYANKGFAYAKLRSPNGAVHVLGTHLQADDTGCTQTSASSVRATQLDEMAQFIRERKIPADETVLLAGDLNIIGGTDEVRTAQARINARPPTSTIGHQFSYDPESNSIAKDRDKGGKRQQLDYIWLLQGGPQNWTNETKLIHSPEWSVTSQGTKYTYNDYTDHYPAFGY